MAPRIDIALSTGSPEATEALGARLARHFRRGDVLYLVGDLGAGKTCLVRGLALGLDSGDRVTSPTFVLLNQYRGRETLFHVDLYRTGGEGIEELGLWDHAENGILVVEWPDLAGDDLPPATIIITMRHGDEPDTRDLTLAPGSDRGESILRAADLA